MLKFFPILFFLAFSGKIAHGIFLCTSLQIMNVISVHPRKMLTKHKLISCKQRQKKVAQSTDRCHQADTAPGIFL